jgi:pimeloyl-ACP methyl ester carboxylesterase
MTFEREGVLPVDGACIWYRIVGTGPLLFVQTPGWGIGSSLYQSTLGDLAQRFTLVFHDTRGSGRSSLAGDDFATADVGRFVLDLEALRQHLDIERFVLLGHSHGGYIAMNYALAYPGRVAALVLVASQLGVDEPQADVRRTLPVLAGDSRFAAAAATFQAPGKFADDAEFSGFLRQVAPLYFKEPSGHGYEQFTTYLDEHQVPLKTFQACAVTNRHFPVRARLAELHIPTLCLVGQSDFICSPVQSQAIHGSIEKSVLVEFRDSGHFCWLEEPELFRSVLFSFLDSSLMDEGSDRRGL